MNNDFSKATSELRKNLLIQVERVMKLSKIACLCYTTIERSSNQILNQTIRFSCKNAL